MTHPKRRGSGSGRTGIGIAKRALEAAATAAVVLVAACATLAPGKSAGVLGHPDAASGGRAAHGGYDWRPLVAVPFGTMLKQSPVRLHEVLLFRDVGNPAAGEGGDCFTLDGVPPRFAGRKPDAFLLCFEHDRLVRIELSLNLVGAEAAALLEQSCAAWGKPVSTAPGGDGNSCESRDEATTISARLTRDRGEGMALLSVAVVRPWLAP